MHKATVYDVAKQAGVSIATVSYTFHHPEKVKKDTQAHILKVADDLGYVRNASAVSLAKNTHNALGLFAFDMLLDRTANIPGPAVLGPDDSSFLFPLYIDEVQRGFQLECWHHNKTLIVDSGGSNEADSVTNIAGRVDGLAIFPSIAAQHMDISYLSARRPIVFFSGGRRDEHVCFINCDNQGGMRMLLHHLVRRHAVRRVVFVGDLASYDVQTRFQELLAIARQEDLRLDSVFGEGNDPDIDGLRKYSQKDTVPDAFICATDQVAPLVIDYLKSVGLRVPEDVIVTGFDGILAGRLSSPTLTTIKQPMEEMGRRAVEVLIRQHGEPFDKKAVTVTLPVQLVIGESCGCGSR